MSTYFSFAVTIYVVGGIIGVLFTSTVADTVGRKNGLLYSQFFSFLGAILQGGCKSSSSYEMLLIGRFSAGISNGLLEGLSTLYSVEIAPIDIRGAVGTVNCLGYLTGILAGTILGISNVLGGKNTWPTLLTIPLAPSILQILILPFMPETPRYLFITKNRTSEAKEVLMKLRNTDNVQTDLVSLEMEGTATDEAENHTILELFSF